ncbi:MAG TPA: HIT domain-containing protein, partial [candidate division Zixibacteria bacterium]|nr:HIT domain-containing protein [candidate division Zixibacteria bacterium]
KNFSLPAIQAPWREGFILGRKEKGCIFCRRLKRKKDRTDWILYRGGKNFVIMNLYPYTSGHLMIVPYRHIAELSDLTPEESAEMMGLAARAIKGMKKALRAEGFNLGMNLGRAAGAGVAGHLHLHVVPRWAGDANFMPVVGKTKVYSVGLQKIYDSLYPLLRGKKR